VKEKLLEKPEARREELTVENPTPQDQQDATLVAVLTEAVQTLTNERDSLAIQIAEAEHKIIADVDVARYECRTALVNVLQNMVDNDEITKEIAYEIFDRFAGELSKAWKNPFQNTWKVTVTQNYDEIMVVEGIEADNEDEAIDDVRNNLTASGIKVMATLSYEGSANTADEPDVEYETYDYDLDDFNLSYEAEQE
jgi:hypothetical protein